MKALKRGEAVAMWHQIARKDFQPEVLTWLAEVAAEILRAESGAPDENKRRLRLVRALGLSGKYGINGFAIRALARDLPRGTAEERKKFREIVAFAIGHPIGTHRAIDDEALDKRISRALANK